MMKNDLGKHLVHLWPPHAHIYTHAYIYKHVSIYIHTNIHKKVQKYFYSNVSFLYPLSEVVSLLYFVLCFSQLDIVVITFLWVSHILDQSFSNELHLLSSCYEILIYDSYLAMTSNSS